tara:strand:- start:2185 stop:2499 length:315 start_codon:yes stop_codon:yes gene_type:complete
MAKKVKKAVKKTAKKVVKKVLDSTTIDEKIIENIDKNRSLYNLILCYIKCYGGYLLAVGAGCTYGANIWWGLALTVGAGAWAYWQVCKCKACKTNMPGGTCCNE